MCYLLPEFKHYKHNLMNKKEKTVDEYCASVERFESWYKSEYNKQRMSRQTWGNVDSNIIQEWIYDLKSNLATSSVKKHIAGMWQFAKFLKTQKVIKENFCMGVEIPSENEKKETEHMKFDEARIMFDTIDNDVEKLMLGLMLFQSYRISEVVNIEVKNINLDNNTITAKRKGNKIQTLKVRLVLRELLAERVAYCKSVGHEFLFQSPDGVKGLTSNAARNVFKKWQERLNFNPEYTSHDLRRCCCWNLYYNEGLELFKVSKIMNHANVKTTEIYLKLDMSAINDELESLDEVL